MTGVPADCTLTDGPLSRGVTVCNGACTADCMRQQSAIYGHWSTPSRGRSNVGSAQMLLKKSMTFSICRPKDSESVVFTGW